MLCPQEKSETKSQKKTGFISPVCTHVIGGGGAQTPVSLTQPSDSECPLFSPCRKKTSQPSTCLMLWPRTWCPIKENVSILGKKVSDLRMLGTLRCGFPLSVYCLRTPTGLKMYGCNTLKNYQMILVLPTTFHVSCHSAPALSDIRFCTFSRENGT